MVHEDMPAGWRELVERAVAEYHAALGDTLLAVACFGSVARGRVDPTSDLDLYIVTRSEVGDSPARSVGHRLRETLEYQALARQGYHPHAMPIFHTLAKLHTHPWILLDIADHGRVFFDPEGLLARALEAVRARLRQLGGRRIQRPDGSWYWDLKPDWRPGEVVEL